MTTHTTGCTHTHVYHTQHVVQDTPHAAHTQQCVLRSFAHTQQMTCLYVPRQIVGDDLLVTNPKRVQHAIDTKACSSLLLKARTPPSCRSFAVAGCRCAPSKSRLWQWQRPWRPDEAGQTAVAVSWGYSDCGVSVCVMGKLPSPALRAHR